MDTCSCDNNFVADTVRFNTEMTGCIQENKVKIRAKIMQIYMINTCN